MTVSRTSLALGVWTVGWVSLALALCWVVAPRQLARACWIGEWPFDNGCSDQPRGGAKDTAPDMYVHFLRQNIGDGHAYAWLTQRLWSQGAGEGQSELIARESAMAKALVLLPMAARLAPNDEGVLAMQAEASLRIQDWQAGAYALAALMERGQAVARGPLVAMMINPVTASAVRQQLTAESRWLDPLLQGLHPKVPVAMLQDFVVEGLHLGVLRTTTVTTIIEQLKTAKSWVDAYSLWIALLGQVPDGLYNAGFDQRTSHRGFDWHWPTQAGRNSGMKIRQAAAAPLPGQMLQIEMTGRGAIPQPMVEQTLVMGVNRLRFRGRYMSDKFDSKEGVVWAMRCASGGERFAQTVPLKNTQRQWTSFELNLDVPAQCLGSFQLRLETTDAWEAASGISGVLYFDAFSLVPQPAG